MDFLARRLRASAINFLVSSRWRRMASSSSTDVMYCGDFSLAPIHRFYFGFASVFAEFDVKIYQISRRARLAAKVLRLLTKSCASGQPVVAG